MKNFTFTYNKFIPSNSPLGAKNGKYVKVTYKTTAETLVQAIRNFRKDIGYCQWLFIKQI